MRDTTRITIDMPTTLVLSVIDRLAEERGLTRSALCRQGLGVLQAIHDAGKEGMHVGLVRDKRRLDTLLIAPL
jgi:hypothetical protein